MLSLAVSEVDATIATNPWKRKPVITEVWKFQLFQSLFYVFVLYIQD